MSISATQIIRLFMLVEAATFVVAAAVHFGTSDQATAVAESVIAIVLLAGWAATWKRPVSAPVIGVAAQAVAFLFTLVGVFTIAIGIGPSTVRDIVYHLGIVAVLAWGIAVANRARLDRASLSAGSPEPEPRAGEGQEGGGDDQWPRFVTGEE